MGKLKGFYKNNRIYCIMMAISIFCIALIGVAFLVYFINQTKTDAYGDRLNGIENVKITDKHKDEVIAGIKENKMVDKVTINVKGKLIYINVYLNSGKKEDAQSIAIKSLDLLTEEEKEFYDINFTFSKESKSEQEASFIMMGYKKSDATIISWTKDNGE